MLDVEVRETLSEIKSITISTISPFMLNSFDSNLIKYGYKYFDSHETRTTYLLFTHKDRVLYYGINSPKQEFYFPMLEGEEGYSPTQTQFEPYVFTRRGVLSRSELRKVFYINTDSNLDGLKSIRPTDDETDEEFFLRNAMWLLDPVVN
ncbi:MAG: hypothetical protein CL582_23415 [Alteromonadaceae bacterium]|nr:hypothetical protein [Alteromonadaceae bacterium]